MLDGITGFIILMMVIYQPGGIHPGFDFIRVYCTALHQFQTDGLTQNQRITVSKYVISQLVKLLILEWPHAVANHVQRFFCHKRTQGMFKLRYAIQINKKRSADLDNGVVARQQTNKIGKSLGDSDIAQITGISDAREQYLVLIATTQHFLHAPHDARCVIVLLHLRIQRIAHHRAVQQP